MSKTRFLIVKLEKRISAFVRQVMNYAKPLSRAPEVRFEVGDAGAQAMPDVDPHLERLKALADSKSAGVDLSAMSSEEAIQLLLKR